MAPNGNPMHDKFDFSPFKPFQNAVFNGWRRHMKSQSLELAKRRSNATPFKVNIGQKCIC